MIEKLDWWEMTFGGGRFVRMAANNWGQWMGESLEIVQFDSWELEAQFQSQKVNMVKPMEFDYCPHCFASFSFRKPVENKCPWCKEALSEKARKE